MTTKIICYEGLKTILRPLNIEKDLARLTEWVNDPEITQFLRVKGPITLEQEREYLEAMVDDVNTVVFAIDILGTDRFIGLMTLRDIDHYHNTATSGAMIGNKDSLGKGYGTDAKMLLLNHAFNVLNLRKVNSSVMEFNQRSAAYLLKSGYVKEGVCRKAFYFNGKRWDKLLFGIQDTEFRKIWARYKKQLPAKK